MAEACCLGQLADVGLPLQQVEEHPEASGISQRLMESGFLLYLL